ncbi:von Willebrand factor type A domain [Teratosphaeria destructans]|uniref:von Willebrand factor type A domain n=1 Tax=Teratosphaeria destructans TaxID=418781 RepID=A0A9W7SWH8_9PEZI|nr:von Willebrand factor type A domain [Teratosphaeria destructans]
MLKRFKSQFGRKAKGSLTKQQDNTQPQRNSVSTEMWPADLNSNPFRDAADAPPAYSPTPNAAPAVQSPSLTVTGPADGADDPYAFLESFDTIFLIDDSGSMAGNRWRETADALETITPICTAHDGDGIDIFFLNTPDARVHHNVNSPTTVREIFQRVRPRGGTPTGQRLNQILKPYMRRFEANPEITKPINIICITDGEPSDDVESPLIAAAKKLDKLDAPAWQVGVQFFQVGRDEEAKRHLKQLDDDLAEIAGDDELRDIVDTVPFIGAEGTHLSGDGILKVVLGAVNRRLDRKKSRDLHR